MQTLLLWMLALYGVASLWIQIRLWLYHSRRQTGIHYHVYTHNSQRNIEGMIRYLAQLARLKGRSYHFSVYDFGSTDDTLAIIAHLQQDGFLIDLSSVLPESREVCLHDQSKMPHFVRQELLEEASALPIVVDLRAIYPLNISQHAD